MSHINNLRDTTVFIVPAYDAGRVTYLAESVWRSFDSPTRTSPPPRWAFALEVIKPSPIYVNGHFVLDLDLFDQFLCNRPGIVTEDLVAVSNFLSFLDVLFDGHLHFPFPQN